LCGCFADKAQALRTFPPPQSSGSVVFIEVVAVLKMARSVARTVRHGSNRQHGSLDMRRKHNVPRHGKFSFASPCSFNALRSHLRLSALSESHFFDFKSLHGGQDPIQVEPRTTLAQPDHGNRLTLDELLNISFAHAERLRYN